jgi:hypothetical protein
MQATIKTVLGYWNDRENKDDTFCVGVAVVPTNTPDAVADALLDQDNVFFVFTEEETLLTNHGEFTLTEVIN